MIVFWQYMTFDLALFLDNCQLTQGSLSMLKRLWLVEIVNLNEVVKLGQIVCNGNMICNQQQVFELWLRVLRLTGILIKSSCSLVVRFKMLSCPFTVVVIYVILFTLELEFYQLVQKLPKFQEQVYVNQLITILL